MENENDILSKIPLDMPMGPYLLGYAQAVHDLNKDWDTFRGEAAKDILCAMIQAGVDDAWRNVVPAAIEGADELVKKLKEGEK